MTMNTAEIADLQAAIVAAKETGREFALATIISTSGSTYRRPGARLLVFDDETLVGNLSGGCLEGDVTEVALDVMRTRTPRLEYYDLTADDDVVWGWGLGCNGAIEVFIEPSTGAPPVHAALGRVASSRQATVLVTVIDSSVAGFEPGMHGIADHPESVFGVPQVDAALSPWVEVALDEGSRTSQIVEVAGGTLRVFVEGLLPPPTLVVCGAGHDAILLTHAAATLGFEVVLVDDRGPFLNESRFPDVSRFVLCDPPELKDHVNLGPHTFVVVMSHNYVRDRDYLQSLIGTSVTYIGMLGPKARTERLLSELSARDVEISAADLERIHGPAGLDLGAEGPEEIATAIVAEIVAVQRRHNAGFLRDRDDPIHDGASRERMRSG